MPYPLKFITAGDGFDVNEMAGETLATHQLVYRNALGTWSLADASIAGTMPCLGITMEAIPMGNYGKILRLGYIGNNSWAWTPGTEIYVSDTAGELTQVAGTLTQIVGMAVSATMIWFNSDIGNSGAVAPAAHAATHEPGGADEVNDIDILNTGTNLSAHAARHENGGADEISVLGLSGLLADAQTPLAHAASHSDGAADEIEVDDLAGANGAAGEIVESDGAALSFVEPDGRYVPAAHAASHKDGGADELDVSELAGALGAAGEIPETDGAAVTWVEPDGRYTPAAHAASHQNGGGDEMDVTGLEGAVRGTTIRTINAGNLTCGGWNHALNSSVVTFCALDEPNSLSWLEVVDANNITVHIATVDLQNNHTFRVMVF